MPGEGLGLAALAGGGLLAAEATGVTDIVPGLGASGGGNRPGRGGGSGSGIPGTLPPGLGIPPEIFSALGGSGSLPPGLTDALGNLSQAAALNAATGGGGLSTSDVRGVVTSTIDRDGNGSVGPGDFGLPGGSGNAPGGSRPTGPSPRPTPRQDTGFDLQDVANPDKGIQAGDAVAITGEAGKAGGSFVNDVVSGTGDIIGDPGQVLDASQGRASDPGGGILGASYEAGQVTGEAARDVVGGTQDVAEDALSQGGPVDSIDGSVSESIGRQFDSTPGGGPSDVATNLADQAAGSTDEAVGRATDAASSGDIAGVGDALAGGTDEFVGGATSGLLGGGGNGGNGGGSNSKSKANEQKTKDKEKPQRSPSSGSSLLPF